MTIGELIRELDLAAKAYERAKQRYTAALLVKRKGCGDLTLAYARHEVAERWLADAAEQLAVLQFEVEDAGEAER